MNKIRVLIVDDHTVVRGGLRLFLMAFHDLELVGEASTGQMAIELCKLHKPDIVIMDLIMPGLNGIEATLQIRTMNPKTKVIALTSFPNDQLVKDAIKAGVSGYLLKTVSPADLVSAIQSVAQGKTAFSAEVEKVIADNDETILYHETLTQREWDVYHLLMHGKSNAEISKKLVISVATVKYHISNILSKLDVKNRSEAIAYAVHHHLME